MKSIIALLFLISFLSTPQESINEYLNKEIVDIDVRGTLIRKKKNNNAYIFEVKSDKSQEIVKIVLPEKTYNIKDIYEFIVPGDYFFKVEGELKFRLGHKFDGNIEIKQFNLLPPKDE